MEKERERERERLKSKNLLSLFTNLFKYVFINTPIIVGIATIKNILSEAFLSVNRFNSSLEFIKFKPIPSMIGIVIKESNELTAVKDIESATLPLILLVK